MGSALRIVVLGAGFAALAAASRLRDLRPEARIRLVAPSRRFLYRPSLIWIPVGLRRRGDIEASLTRYFEQHRLEFTPASVTGIADGGRTVLTDRGRVRNDALVVATGASYRDDIPGLEHTFPLCESADAAERIRVQLGTRRGGRIAIGFGENEAEPGASRAQPMLELAFGLDTWLRAQGRRRAFELLFFGPNAQPTPHLGHEAAARVWSRLDHCDIEVRCGDAVRAFAPGRVHFGSGDLAADLVVYTPGMTGPPWRDGACLPVSPGGFIEADAACRVGSLDRVYAAGDVGSFPVPEWLPKLAHTAQLEGVSAATNLHAELDGEARADRFPHELVCIVDALDTGTLVYRDPAHTFSMADSPDMHEAKCTAEQAFLRRLSPPAAG